MKTILTKIGTSIVTGWTGFWTAVMLFVVIRDFCQYGNCESWMDCDDAILFFGPALIWFTIEKTIQLVKWFKAHTVKVESRN